MPQWITDTVGSFWEAAGGPERFPRRLEEAVLWALPLAVLKLSRLWVADVEDWLANRGIEFRLAVPNRSLRGCLVAHAGKGIVLLDGTDPEDEQRFSLAHESAHFMVDYLEPRQKALTAMNESIVEVLDGLRPATREERINALLTGQTIGVHTHLMDREPDGRIGCRDTAGAEGRADRLALELLAPASEVRRRLARGAGPQASYDERVRRTLGLLAGTFGVPLPVADDYARWLCRVWFGEADVREWLGM